MQMCIKEDIKRSHSPQAGKKLLLSGKEPHPEPTQGSWAPAPNILCPAIPSSTHLLSEAVGAAAGPQLQGSPVLVAPGHTRKPASRPGAALHRSLDPSPSFLEASPPLALGSPMGSIRGFLLSCWRELPIWKELDLRTRSARPVISLTWVQSELGILYKGPVCNLKEVIFRTQEGSVSGQSRKLLHILCDSLANPSFKRSNQIKTVTMGQMLKRIQRNVKHSPSFQGNWKLWISLSTEYISLSIRRRRI